MTNPSIDAAANDAVNHPSHYTKHPSGIECIQITEHMSFNLGNAVKYIWRADLKGNTIEDLRKAQWYIDRELAKRQNEQPTCRVETPRPNRLYPRSWNIPPS